DPTTSKVRTAPERRIKRKGVNHDMFTNNIINTQPTVLPGTSAGGGQVSETAGFDFMTYLLGLQTSPVDDGNAFSSLLDSSVPDSGTEDLTPQKKENSPWNLIFPGMTPQP